MPAVLFELVHVLDNVLRVDDAMIVVRVYLRLIGHLPWKSLLQWPLSE